MADIRVKPRQSGLPPWLWLALVLVLALAVVAWFALDLGTDADRDAVETAEPLTPSLVLPLPLR